MDEPRHRPVNDANRPLTLIAILVGVAIAIGGAIAMRARPVEEPTIVDVEPIPAPSAPPIDERALAIARGADRAAEIMAQRCAICHGREGHADGPAVTALNPKPRDWRDASVQEALRDDAWLESIIVNGGARVGKSPLMAPNADLAGQPDVVAALMARVRAVARGP